MEFFVLLRFMDRIFDLLTNWHPRRNHRIVLQIFSSLRENHKAFINETRKQTIRHSRHRILRAWDGPFPPTQTARSVAAISSVWTGSVAARVWWSFQNSSGGQRNPGWYLHHGSERFGRHLSQRVVYSDSAVKRLRNGQSFAGLNGQTDGSSGRRSFKAYLELVS